MADSKPAGIRFRAAEASDAPAIARTLRRSLDSLGWMPRLHTPDEDLVFIRDTVLPRQSVTVAEAGGAIVGFVAGHAGWINLIYLDPEWTGQGIGSRLLETAAADAGELKLYCFQANVAARRFYERHGFRATALSGGSGNEEGLPDVLYVRPAAIKPSPPSPPPDRGAEPSLPPPVPPERTDGRGDSPKPD